MKERRANRGYIIIDGQDEGVVFTRCKTGTMMVLMLVMLIMILMLCHGCTVPVAT